VKVDGIAAILGVALASDELAGRAADLVNRFGRQGYLTLRGLLG
jgi:hypothetical protein